MTSLAFDLDQPVIAVPTYNEKENLPLIVSKIRAELPQINILIVDDNSPDGTGELADQMAQSDPRLFVLHREGKAGLGAAYLDAFSQSIAAGAKSIVQMDADGSHDPKDLKNMLTYAKDYDVVVGSRWVKGGQVVNWPWLRKAISKGGSFYSKLMLGVRARDVTSGFKVWKAEVLEKIDFSQIHSRGYCFQINLLWEASKQGAKILEVPITFADREHGVSKMSGGIVAEALWRVTVWGFSRLKPGKK